MKDRGVAYGRPIPNGERQTLTFDRIHSRRAERMMQEAGQTFDVYVRASLFTVSRLLIDAGFGDHGIGGASQLMGSDVYDCTWKIKCDNADGQARLKRYAKLNCVTLVNPIVPPWA